MRTALMVLALLALVGVSCLGTSHNAAATASLVFLLLRVTVFLLLRFLPDFIRLAK